MSAGAASGDPDAGARGRRRIVVGVNASRQSVQALISAAELASSLGAELVGVFVHDANLFRLGEHGRSTEVLMWSGSTRAVTTEDVERELRAQAARARRAIAIAAESSGLAWSFHQQRGIVADEILAVGETSFLVVVARGAGLLEGRRRRLGPTARAVLSRSRLPLLFMSSGDRWRGPVGVVIDDSAGALAALDLAADLTPPGGRIVVFVLRSVGDPEATRRVAAEALSRTARMPVHVDIRELRSAQYPVVTDAVREAGARSLVLNGGMRFVTEGTLESLVADLPFPVVVLPARPDRPHT